MRVIKVSGHQLDDAAYVSAFATSVAEIAQAESVVLVNGGGKSIKQLQDVFELPEKKIEGLRVTDAQSLWITEMVMSAQMNKLLVRALLAAGVDAVGLSGVDGHLLTAQKKWLPGRDDDLGFVGEIIDVRVSLLQRLLDLGLTPVLSPVSCDVEGQHYNINADEAATAVAQKMGADQLDFVSNVPGVLQDLSDAQPIATLTVAATESLKQDGVISGGMIPKVKAAVAAVQQGVQRARIVDLIGLRDGGTVFTNQ